MTAFINPGSHIGETGEGWTNTFTGAMAEARRWLANMHAEGIRDVEIVTWDPQKDGRWRIYFEHSITKKRVVLETHGIDNLDAYRKKHLFDPRVYWNGSSLSEPTIEDFAVPGFRVLQTFESES